MTNEEFRQKADKVYTLKEWLELSKEMPEGVFIEKNFIIPSENFIPSGDWLDFPERTEIIF